MDTHGIAVSRIGPAILTTTALCSRDFVTAGESNLGQGSASAVDWAANRRLEADSSPALANLFDVPLMSGAE